MQIFPWVPSLGNAKFPCAQVAPARAARGVVPEGQLGRFDHRTDISRLKSVGARSENRRASRANGAEISTVEVGLSSTPLGTALRNTQLIVSTQFMRITPREERRDGSCINLNAHYC